MLKETADVIAKPVEIIFTKSLDQEQLQRKWKDAVITPLYKKGPKYLAQNYRPVSLTCILCKTLERIIVEDIIQHLEDNNLKCKQQHGFSKGRSTVTNLREALNVWTEALRHKIPVDIIYLDYAKAFDTVPHQRLLRKIQGFGIEGKLHGWIENFLTDRRQKVHTNGSESSWKRVKSGVPQGSVLRPALFSMYLSDVLKNLCKKQTVHLEAYCIHSST